MARWLPAVFLGTVFLATMRDAETRHLIDPGWLALAATFWIGDFLVLWGIPMDEVAAPNAERPAPEEHGR